MDFILEETGATVGIYTAKKGNHTTFNTVLKRIHPYFKKNIKVIRNLNKISLDKIDYLLIDEGQRLRHWHKFSGPIYFQKNKDVKNEIEWLDNNSINYTIYYDLSQSFHKNDMNLVEYIIPDKQYDLISQFRMNAGDKYIQFIKEFLQMSPESSDTFNFGEYQFELFNSEVDMYDKVKKMNKSKGKFNNKSRLLSSLEYPKWKTKNLFKNMNDAENINYDQIDTDFKIGDDKLVWNKKAYDGDWLEKGEFLK